MFGKLKEKLKSALSVFSKKAEEEADIIPAPPVKKEKPIVEEKHPEISKKEEPVHKIIEKVKEDFKKEKVQAERKKFQEKLAKEEKIKKQEFSEEEIEKVDELIEKEKKKKTTEEIPLEYNPALQKYEPDLVKIKDKQKEKEVKKEEKVKEIIPRDQVKITYFVHGTTTDNEKDHATGWLPGELSKLGIKQAKELGSLVSKKHFDVVFCSDLKRAVDSAELGFANKYKIIQDQRLRECNYGDFNGKSETFKDKITDYINKTFPNGESYKEVEKRILNFLNYLYDNYKGKHVAIVAHQAPELAIEVLLNGKTWEQAFAEDWRKRKAWQPGWDYTISEELEIPKEEQPQPEKKGFFGRLFRKKEEKEEVEEKPEEKEIEVKEEPKEEIKEIPEEKGFFGKVKESLTTKKISAEKFEELFWELELTLLENNVSVEVIEKIKEDLKKELVDKPLPRDIMQVIEDTLKNTLHQILSFETEDLLDRIKNKSKKPYIIAFFGVNGAGKTTSIAKLAYYLKQNKLSVVLAACDTFRAAAIQQLGEHAEKLGVKMIQHDYGADAAAVAFDAVKYAEKNQVDIVMIDTAGRLHSNTNLMAELDKIIRVTKPDLKIFVGESITGNDCIEQAMKFDELVKLDGTILTKADVDEKGGAPLSIAYTIKKPILFLGVGQEYKDLEKFDADVIMKRLGF